jgi:hypothetical protein
VRTTPRHADANADAGLQRFDIPCFNPRLQHLQRGELREALPQHTHVSSEPETEEILRARLREELSQSFVEDWPLAEIIFVCQGIGRRG